jgi:hypothetical protein
MQKIICAYAFLLLLGASTFFTSCKKHDRQDPPVIIPTVNPAPYSVMIYLITPADMTFNPDYYRAAKSCIQNIQSWYKTQMGNNKTFLVNPVVVDTMTGVHNASWYTANNGDSISGSSVHAYNNIKYEVQHMLGENYDTVHHAYFAWVPVDFGEETIKGNIGVQGVPNLNGLMGKFPESSQGSVAHSMGHAFNLADNMPEDPSSIMSAGRTNYPNCVLLASDRDTLNTRPFMIVQ